MSEEIINAEVIEESYTATELKKYDMTDASLAKLKSECLSIKVEGPLDKINYDIARAKHIKVKGLLSDVEGKRKDLGRAALQHTKAVNARAAEIKASLLEDRDYLETQRKIVEDEEKRLLEAKEKAIQAAKVELSRRHMLLIEVGYKNAGDCVIYGETMLSLEEIGDLPIESFNEIVETAKNFQAELKAAARKEQAKQDAELKQAREEQAKQDAELKQRETALAEREAELKSREAAARKLELGRRSEMLQGLGFKYFADTMEFCFLKLSANWSDIIELTPEAFDIYYATAKTDIEELKAKKAIEDKENAEAEEKQKAIALKAAEENKAKEEAKALEDKKLADQAAEQAEIARLKLEEELKSDKEKLIVWCVAMRAEIDKLPTLKESVTSDFAGNVVVNINKELMDLFNFSKGA